MILDEQVVELDENDEILVQVEVEDDEVDEDDDEVVVELLSVD